MAFQIVRNDITKITADAIVNTANPEPTFMAGTDAAVYMAAGAEKLLEARSKIGPIEEGEVAVTPAFGLNAKYIFHTVGPIWQGGGYNEKETVRKCYENCLKKAVELNIESIAFPLISTGVYGFPKADALIIATSVFSEFLSDHELDITLAVFDNESFELSGKIFAGVNEYIDEHYVEDKSLEEYGTYAAAVSGASYNAAGFGMASNEAIDACEAVEEEALEAPAKGHEKPRFADRLRGVRGKHSHMRDDVLKSVEMPPPPVSAEAMAKTPAPKKRSLDDVVKNLTETWSESLLRLIDEKGYTDVEVYKRANVDRKHFSKIRSDKDYLPKKKTALAFALALRLNIDEAKDFLGRAGFAFSPSSKTDVIVQYFIENEVYNIMTINLALYEHDEPLLG